MNSKLLLPSSVGFFLLAVITSFVSWNNTNIWIPISAILIILGIFTFIIRSMFNSIDERLKNLEKNNK